MSNRVDFFESARGDAAISAGTAVVLVDGVSRGELAPLEIVRGSWPGFGYARLSYNPAGCEDADVIGAEMIEQLFATGASVRIEVAFGDEGVDGRVSRYPVFAGSIESIETRIDESGEAVEVLARDYSAVLERVTVCGRRVEQEGGGIMLGSMDTRFNPDGLANGSISTVEHNGRSYRGFSLQDGGGRMWSFAEAIDYLLAEYLPDNRLSRPSLERLRALTDDRKARDLDVTERSLLEALQLCCELTGLKFRFDARPDETGPAEAIVFYRDGRGREVELNCQQRGEQLGISRTNVAALRSRRNRWPVTCRYTGQGDFKLYEATFELVGCWSSSHEGTDYDTFSPVTNPAFHEVRNVYRKWCLNEAGEYSGPPVVAGPAYDFSSIFEGDDYVQRRRRFRPCLSTDSLGRSLGYYLEVSYSAGNSWTQYSHGFNTFLNECGVWLSSDYLDMDVWNAAITGQLRFRMTASVAGDRRLTRVAFDGPVGGAAPVDEKIVIAGRRFAYRKVMSQSIFFGGGAMGEADEADDGQALADYVRQEAQSNAATIETFDVRTLSLETDYHPGDRVTSSPESRDLFAVRSDNRSLCWIENVRVDFAGQFTELQIVRKRVR